MLQKLNYTENPVDVPNPDRGFERGNDDSAGNGIHSEKTPWSARWGHMTIPVDANTVLGQPFKLAYEMTPPFYLGGATKGPEYCNVPVEPRIVQFYLVLNYFSSNAWCQCTEGEPDKHTRVGVDGPITEYGLNYLREQFEFIRNETNSVAHIRPCYEPKGWNHVVWTADNLRYEDGPVMDNWYQQADYSKALSPDGLAEHIANPVPGTWRGSSPIFRKCTVPGFTDMNWVQYHYKQLEPVFHEYSDVIWAFDSGTFGPWGETHSSYDAEVPENYKIILDSLLAAVPDGKPIMTHIGAFLAWYNRTYNTSYSFGDLDKFPDIKRGTPESRIGMFDDSTGWSADEYNPSNNGSLTEGYRMLAYDPTLPGFNPEGKDPSLARIEEAAPGGRIGSVIGYNDSGTNRLVPIPEEEGYTDTRWRGVWFVDWDRAKLMRFIKKMSVFGGEHLKGPEPELIDGKPNNGAFVPVGRRIDNPYNDVILRFPFVLNEASKAHWTYVCIEQGAGRFKSRADYLYTRENIEVELTYPWSGEKVKVFYDPLYEGQSALAYYRDRMGFRFVLREANTDETVEAKGGTLKFDGKVQNVGWGNVFNTKKVSVLLQSKNGNGCYSAVTGIDVRDWQPAEDGNSRADNKAAWRNFGFAIKMEDFGNVPSGEYNIFLKITDPRETSVNKRSIRFANHDIWNEALGANLIGSITLKV